MQRTVQQGSLHYTPEHCLVNGGFPLFRWKKPCFKWAKWRSFKEPCSETWFLKIPLQHTKQRVSTVASLRGAEWSSSLQSRGPFFGWVKGKNQHHLPGESPQFLKPPICGHPFFWSLPFLDGWFYREITRTNTGPMYYFTSLK